MEQSLKRKRDEDEASYPRITYNAGERTFDRLLKADTLEEMKEVVRKKLGYSRDIAIQLTQLRDGRRVDLEDEEDFEAFYSAARAIPVVTVQVTTASSTHRETPRMPFEPQNTPASEEATKKRKKKRKLNDVTKDDEPVEYAEKNRKTVVSLGSPEPKTLPPKKKKKQDAEAAAPKQNLAPSKEPSGEATIAAADASKTAPAPAPAPPKAKQPAPIVVQEPVPDQPPTLAAVEPAKKKKKAAVIDKAPTKVLSDPPKTVEADTPKPAEDNQETTNKSKKKQATKKNKKPAEEGGPEKPSLEESSKEKEVKAGAKKTKTATVAVNGAEGQEDSDVGGVIYVNRTPQQKAVASKEPVVATSSAPEKPTKATPVSAKKKVAPKTAPEPPSAVKAVSAATKGGKPIAQEESESSKEEEEEEEGSGSEADKANEKAAEKEKEKAAEKEKEKAAEQDREKAIVKGKEKAAEKAAEKEKGTKVKAKEKESRPSARASVGPPVLNTQSRAEELAALITLAGQRGAQRKSKANGPAPQPATTEKPSGDAITPDPKSKSATRKPISKAPARISEPKSNADEEKPEERKLRASRSKLRWPVSDQCPYCLRTPRHTKSRCTFIRSSGTKGLQDRLVILEEDPDINESTRKAFVEEIKELIATKEEKERSSSAKVAVKPAELPANSNASSAPPSEPPLVPDDNASPPRDSSPDEPLAISNRKPSAVDKTKVFTPAPPKPHALFTAIEGVSSRLSASVVITDKQLQAGRKPAASALSEKQLAKQTQPTSATAPQPKNQPTVSVIQQKTKPAASEISSSSSSSSNESAPFATLAAPSISTPLIETASLEEQLDVIVRGPSARIRVAEIASSESDEAEEEDIGLLEEEVEKEEPPISKAMRFSAVRDSSDEEESEASVSEEDAPAVASPHQATSSRLPSTESPEASDGKNDDKSNHAGERSFHDVNELASSMEDDRAGDRAFSEALAEDTAVFRMTVDDAGTSLKTTSGDDSDKSDNDEEGKKSASSSSSSSEEESRAVTPLKRSPQHRKDDIEEFETPKRAHASPIVEVNFAKMVQSTPRVMDRMRTRSGKAPLPTPQRAASSHDKAMNLLERVKQSQSQTAEKRALPARATRSSSRVQSGSLPQPPSTPATQKGKATATVLSEVTETKDQDEDEAQEHERGDARVITETPMSLDTWAVLEEDITMGDGEVTTMVDELESTNEHDISVHFSSQSKQGQSSSQQALFIESETQQSFPYSQWTSNKPRFHESNDESDEEQEVERAIKQPGPSAQRQSQSFRRLTDIASQDISFHANSVALRPANFANKQKATEKDLFGNTSSSDSETSDSDSDSEEDNKKFSHIPKSRRAGAVSSEP